MFLKIFQNSQENACARVSFLIKLQASAVIDNKAAVLTRSITDQPNVLCE